MRPRKPCRSLKKFVMLALDEFGVLLEKQVFWLAGHRCADRFLA
jgi:hypothetical protein